MKQKGQKHLETRTKTSECSQNNMTRWVGPAIIGSVSGLRRNRERKSILVIRISFFVTDDEKQGQIKLFGAHVLSDLNDNEP